MAEKDYNFKPKIGRFSILLDVLLEFCLHFCLSKFSTPL